MPLLVIYLRSSTHSRFGTLDPQSSELRTPRSNSDHVIQTHKQEERLKVKVFSPSDSILRAEQTEEDGAGRLKCEAGEC